MTGEGNDLGGMEKRSPGASLDHQLKEVKESGDRSGTGSGPKIVGPATPAAPPAASHPPRVSFSLSVDPEAHKAPLTARIQSSYLHGIRQCGHATAKQGALPERMRLTFVVAESGRATQVSSKGTPASLGSCIEAKVRGWRFATARDADGEAEPVDVDLTLRFIPAE
jgi:hypothetical protein